jgi:hypothetical protein
MSIQNQIFTSFIKGIAKTTGSLTVLTFAAILWQLTQKTVTIQQTGRREECQTQNIQTGESDHIEETDKNELESSFINMENENLRDQDVIKQNGSDKKLNFKKIFDKI